MGKKLSLRLKFRILLMLNFYHEINQMAQKFKFLLYYFRIFRLFNGSNNKIKEGK